MKQPVSLGEGLNRAADRLTGVAGSLWALLGALLLVLVWAITGPILQLADEVQLFVNTATTVLAFGTVVAIQTRRGSTAAGEPVQAQPDQAPEGQTAG